MSDKTEKKFKVTIETTSEYLEKIMNAVKSVKSNSIVKIVSETLKPMIPMIDHKYLANDITTMKEFLEKIQPIFDDNFKILSHEVNVRNPDSRGYKYNPDIKVHEIDPGMIKNPACGSESDSRGESKKVVKRILRDAIEIACKSFNISADKVVNKEYQTTLRYLPILEKLGHDDCSTNIGNKYLDLLNWMAPEKMQKYKNTNSSLSPETDAELYPYTQKSWEHNPDVRISLEQLYIDVSNMSKKVIPGKDPAILTINNSKSDEPHKISLSEDEINPMV
ncbi:18243_t:CDS:2 [Dentiscutata erythropus]|uniref:18243_t:CDS:1 n=1 Tax=Dentiscutata erythropus TaxID=1348616 RepID=A0A9N8VS34_9GLOM|nr:18243_t:CDS:2 [Dentiscutata erythropus]